jgi:hypothetical protein
VAVAKTTEPSVFVVTIQPQQERGVMLCSVLRESLVLVCRVFVSKNLLICSSCEM